MNTTVSTPSPVPEGRQFTAFQGHQRLAAGAMEAVMRAAARASEDPESSEPVLVFDDATGMQTDLGALAAPVAAAAEVPAQMQPAEQPARQAGRPKLGVVAKEVTLLPRHWEWLALQPGGASVTLRRLVDDARRSQGPREAVRAAQERCYRFVHAIAGNLPGYEDALRALYRADAEGFNGAMETWPRDVRDYAAVLAAAAFTASSAG
ncbi:DUF2239 family protein [Azohydromonas australica]|uniref:DUF2239 family protein n=1 Tax=Azohydromonas australica TaxID=364039 RepID=UPI000416E28E